MESPLSFGCIRFGPAYFLKKNISDLRPCSQLENVILEFRPIYFSQKSPQNAGNAFFREPKFKFFSRGIPPDPATNVLLFNNVIYFVGIFW